MLRASEVCEKAGFPTSSLVCEGFLGQASATSVGLGMPNMPVATIVGHPGAQSVDEIRANAARVTAQHVIDNLLTQPEVIVVNLQSHVYDAADEFKFPWNCVLEEVWEPRNG